MQEKNLGKMQSALSAGELFDDSLEPLSVEGPMSRGGLAVAIVLALGIWLMFVYFVEMAHAHPVDDPCPPGFDTEDGCQPVVAALGLSDPAFFAAHKSYWHCRREIVVSDIVPYAVCVGKIQELESLLYGYVISSGHPNIMGYWNVIPAHPELDFPGQVWRADEQRLACDANRAIIQYHIYLCNFYRAQLRGALGR